MMAKALLLLGLAALGSSLTIPRELENGLYLSYRNAAGDEIHELLVREGSPEHSKARRDAYSSAAEESFALSRRATAYPDYEWCGCGK